MVKQDSTWHDKVYGESNPALGDLTKSVKGQLPAHIVSLVFRTSIALMSKNASDTESLLAVFNMISHLLDVEPSSLKDVTARAWLGCIIKALPIVSL